MSKSCCFIIIVILALTITSLGQRTNPPLAPELEGITKRGRDLFAYDEAAWHSTDAVVALAPAKGSFESYIGHKSGDKWTVAYGKLNADRDRYLVVYEASQGSTPADFTVKAYEQPKEDRGFYLSGALAIGLAKADFGSAGRPYNVAVLPGPSGQLYVYLLPAQTVSDVFPLGGDVRYLVSPDGKKIVEKRQLHRSIIEFQVPKGTIPESGYHTAILDDIPEDTDVFHVLTRCLGIPELVVTNKYVYQIKSDGSIIYVMTREAFQKVGKPSN